MIAERHVHELEEKVDHDKALALLEYERHRAMALEERCQLLEKQNQRR